MNIIVVSFYRFCTTYWHTVERL